MKVLTQRSESITISMLKLMMANYTKGNGNFSIPIFSIVSFRLAIGKDIKDGVGVMFW